MLTDGDPCLGIDRSKRAIRHARGVPGQGKEWVFVNGKWTEQDIEEAKSTISRANIRDLEEEKMQVFSNFLDKLSKI